MVRIKRCFTNSSWLKKVHLRFKADRTSPPPTEEARPDKTPVPAQRHLMMCELFFDALLIAR
jgi:hypothetical protein